MYVYVKSMSTTQRDLKNRLFDQADKIALHIAKLLLYPESPSKNHWITEIHAFLYDVPKLKTNNKRPSPEFISKALIDYSGDRGEDFHRYAIKEENNSNYSDISYDAINKACCEYFSWLGTSLNKDRVSLDDVSSELSTIMQKYGG